VRQIVAQRTTEIGIRIALGAQREQVLRLVLVDGLRPALIGLALGLSAGATVTREIQSLLYGTRPLDPTVFSLVSLVLLVVTALFQRGEPRGLIHCGHFGSNSTATLWQKESSARRSLEPCLMERIRERRL
jgi:predicted lysophospholipase L1 biosynthesis ABC-type transport system permease subunit